MSRVRAFAAVIILESDDVVFAEVIATLYFDDVHRFVKWIGNSVHSPDRDIG